jgi:hypothetical protein
MHIGNSISKNLFFITISLIFITISCSNKDSGYWKKHISKKNSWEYLFSKTENILSVNDLRIWQKLDENEFNKVKEIHFNEKNKDILYLKTTFEIYNKDSVFQALLQSSYNIEFEAFLNGVKIAKKENGEILNNLPPNDRKNNKIGVYDYYTKQNFFIDKKTIIKALQNESNTLIIKILNKNKATLKYNDFNFFTNFESKKIILNEDNPNYYPKEYFVNSTLPIIKINTNKSIIVDTPKIIADMGVINKPTNNSVNDSYTDYEGKIAIEIRGSTSQAFAQKSYSFKTIYDDNKKNSVSLLGLPKDNDWVLYGPYTDKTLIRNNLIYQLGREIGLYASKTVFCELIINGDYRGIYVLIQRIKINKNFIDIANLKFNDTTETKLTGGYLLKIDKGDDDFWSSPFPKEKELSNKYWFRYVQPKGNKLHPKQKEFITNYVIKFEEKLYYNKFDEIENYIDLNSFIDYFIINEFSKNIDAYRLSTFFYKDKNEKLKMGPLWDYNFSLGLPNYENGYSPEGWIYNSSVYIPFWYNKLMEYPKFKKQLAERWDFLRKNTLSLDNIFSIIDKEISLIEIPYKRHSIKWNIENKEIWPNYYVGKTFKDDVDYMKDWIRQRLNWLDENIKK